jgi:hypothetical protein
MKEYIESININIIKDNGIFRWCWYHGEYWVTESYEDELIEKLSAKLEVSA